MCKRYSSLSYSCNKNLKRVADLGMTRIILETDTQVLRDALRTTAMDRSPNGGLLRRDMMYIEFVRCLLFQDHVTLADCLADHDANDLCAGSQVFASQALDFVLPLVSRDLTRSNV
jgi:hypothetical protein